MTAVFLSVTWLTAETIQIVEYTDVIRVIDSACAVIKQSGDDYAMVPSMIDLKD